MTTMDTNALRLVDQGLAVPYVVAVWMGMPTDEIRTGLRNGAVAPPVGEAADWLPGELGASAARDPPSGTPVGSGTTTLNGSFGTVSLTSASVDPVNRAIAPFAAVSLASPPLSATASALRLASAPLDPVNLTSTPLPATASALRLASAPLDPVNLTKTPLPATANPFSLGGGFPLEPRQRVRPAWDTMMANTLDAAANDAVNGVANDGVAAVTIDRDAVHGWLFALDPKLTTASFDAIWERAGSNDALRAKHLFGYLRRTLLGDDFPVDSAAETPEATHAAHAALAEFVADPDHRARVVDLSGKDGAELAQLARTDVGYRYALAEVDPVALCGNRALFAAHNLDGELDRFNADTGEARISDAWLADRAKFLAWKLAADEGQQTTIDGGESWSFIDRSATDVSGGPLAIELEAANGGPLRHQVIFGADVGEVITGRGGTDRIYGGGGDDVLRGGAGADRIEGGQGDDLVMGSTGNDDLFGNQGDDEIDGGGGADRLSGGGGADTLTGGRGDDRLEGGEGNDTYMIDAGDGVDTIVDADGLGSIMLDGAALTGVTQHADGVWTSADGRVEFAFSGEAEEGGTLTIRAFDVAADYEGRPANVIRLREWRNGDLGITLGDGSAGALAQSGSALDTTEDEPTADTPEVGGFAAGHNAQERMVVGESEVWYRPAISDGALNDTGWLGDEQLAEPDAPVATSEQGQSATSDTEVPSPSESAGLGADVASSSEGAASNRDVPSLSEDWDFDAALAELWGSADGNAFNATATGVDLQTLSRAVEAFSGVLEPPDISAVSNRSFASNYTGVSANDIADALAFDDAGDFAPLEPPIALDPRTFGTGREMSAPLPAPTLPTGGMRGLRESG